jgi:hypothetical protein
VNCFGVPCAALGMAGVTPIDTNVAAVTVKGAVPDMPADVAVMVVGPAATAVASPALLMVATVGAEELHVTPDERTDFEPSLYTPVAVNWEVESTATLGSAVETVIEVRVGAGMTAAPPPPQPAMNPVRPNSSAAAIDLNPNIDVGEKRTAN